MTQVIVVSNRFPQLAGQFDRMLEDAFDAGVLTCIAAADPLTRVDTGALRANKSIARSTGSRDITWNEDYAGYQNDGTRYMEGTHFANQGMDAAAPVVESHLKGFGH
jgi:hypothetical protein